MKTHKNPRFTALLLCAALLAGLMTLSLVGCEMKVMATDLMEGIGSEKEPGTVSEESTTAAVDFAVEIFKQAAAGSENENTLVSPLSILSALAMTANGAKGETLSALEEVFGMKLDRLNEFMSAYCAALPSSDKYKFSLANSIWIKDDDGLKVNRDFLQSNADYYGAAAYKAPFDRTTLNDVNNWVSSATDGMIKNMLNKIPEQTVMMLINALSFDAEWQSIYRENQVRDGEFTNKNGTGSTVEFMCDNGSGYLADDNTLGFIRHYADKKYAFVALLPDESISIGDYIRSLSGEKLLALINAPVSGKTNTKLPKFETESSFELAPALTKMGAGIAFDANRADFSGIGTHPDGPLFIGSVLHKTYICVSERGTRAGAATIVQVSPTAAPPEQEIITDIYLDRPFVYMIVDCEHHLPVFIGTLGSME